MKKLFKQKNKAFTRTPKLGVTQKGGGFTLVETLVAISIFSVSILGIMSVLASGISHANYAKQKMIALYLAQEGIEYVRNIRDSKVLFEKDGWNKFKDVADATITPPAPSDTGFTRTIQKNVITGGDEVKIFSKVEWTQGSGVKSVTFSENLFNWAP